MTLTYYVNSVPASLADTYFQLKEQLKLVGWTVTKSGDGTSYNSTGDNITTAAVMNNTNSWYVITQPVLDGYQKHICVQSGATKYSLRIKLSWTGFSGGSPTGSVTPTATDQAVIWGSGTDASPSFTNLIDTTFTNIRNQIIVGDASDNYFVCWMTTKATGGQANAIFMIDKVTDTHALDIDPFVYSIYGSSASPTTDLNNNSSNKWSASTNPMTYAWARKGFSNEVFSRCFVNFFNLGTASNYQLAGLSGANPYDGFDYHLPMMFFCDNTVITGTNQGPLTFYKGQSVHCRLATTSRATLDTANTRTRVYFGPIVLPWNGTTPSV